MTNGAQFAWESGNIAQSGGTGTITIGSGGSRLSKTTDSGNSTVTCGLPIINNGGVLGVYKGTLDVTGVYVAKSVSVYQSDGQISFGTNTTLEVDHGLRMDDGILANNGTGWARIAVGDVSIGGGVVSAGHDAGEELICDGAVSLFGGTYKAVVDLTTMTSSLWSAKSFSLSGASLEVDSEQIPSTVPANRVFKIMATAAPNNFEWHFDQTSLAIGTTGQSYTAGVDGYEQNYDVTTP